MDRVISPFLTIYRPQLTSMTSIMEWVSGIILVIGILIEVLLLKLKPLLLSYYVFYSLLYTVMKGGLSGFIINAVLFFLLLNFVYHLVFGSWFIFWERTSGFGKVKKFQMAMQISEIYKSTYILLGLVLIITIMSWLYLIV